MAEAKRPDSRGLSFFDITDFSPGIYDNSLITASVAPSTVPGIFPAPPGAADATATFGCLSLPNGGLGPLPALGGAPGTAGQSLDDLGITLGAITIDISALINSYQSAGDELVIGVTFVVTTAQATHFYSYVESAASLNSIQNATYNFTTDAKNFVAYPFSTVIDNGGTIQPVVVLPVAAPDGPNANLLVYPSVAAPTTFSTDVITQHPIGNAFGHQGRIVNIQLNTAYSWPVGITNFPNEAFSYTDPPQTETWPQQFEIFGPENPFGYGAVASVSAGELFAIKRRGGAVIIQGDLNNPTVTTLPGVQSTGVIYGRTDTDQNGMYYCAEQHGAWVWNGGNTSSKISAQLDDAFFTPTSPPTDTTYYGYYCQRWGEWMMFSNNWIFNSTTGAWWRLTDPAVKSFFWYVPGYDPRHMFCALPTVTSSAEKFLWEYDRTIPGQSFTWQSLPIKMPAEDRTSTVRELVIRASNPYDDAAPQIIATLIDDKGNTSTLPTWVMTTGINTVQEWRVNAGVKQTTTIAVNLACSGTDFAPVVHGLSMGSRSREHAGAH